MAFEPEISIICGHISEIEERSIRVWPGTRIISHRTLTPRPYGWGCK
jgi:hypothetical protein